MSLPSVGHNIVIDLDKKTAQIINTKSDGSKNILTIFANSPNKQDNTFNAGDTYTITDENGKTITNAELDTGAVANFLKVAMDKTPEQLKSLKEIQLSGSSFNPANAGEKRLFEYANEMNETAKKAREAQEKAETYGAIANSYHQLYNMRSIGSYYPTNTFGYNTPVQTMPIGGYYQTNALSYNTPIQNMPIGGYQNPYRTISSYPSTTNYSVPTLPINNNTYYDYSISEILDNTDYSKSPLYRKYAKNPDMLFKIMELQQASQFNRLFNAHLNAEYNNPYTRWSAMYDFAHGDYGSLHRYNRNQAMKRNAFMYASGGIHPYNAIYQTNARQAAIRNELARMGLSMYDLDYNFW